MSISQKYTLVLKPIFHPFLGSELSNLIFHEGQNLFCVNLKKFFKFVLFIKNGFPQFLFPGKNCFFRHSGMY